MLRSDQQHLATSLPLLNQVWVLSVLFTLHSSRTCSGTEQTTVIATPTITDEKGKGEITATFDENSKLHNYYLCKSSDCCTISPTDTPQSLKAKFSHSWVSTKDLSFDKTSGLWWLVYEENKGMFCLLCRKHNLKSRRSKSDVWYTTPSVQLRYEAVQDHLTTTQHKEAIKLEMMQRVSTFQKQVNEKHEVNENMLEKTFTAIYWLAKEEISNQKLIPLSRTPRKTWSKRTEVLSAQIQTICARNVHYSRRKHSRNHP